MVVPLAGSSPPPALIPTRLLEHVSDAVVCLDRAWRTTYLNVRAGLLLGREPEALLGRVFWDECPPPLADVLRTAMECAVVAGAPIVVETDASPGISALQHRVEPFADGVVLVSTARAGPLREHAELAAQARHLLAVLETVPECVTVVSRDGWILDINTAGLAMLEAPSRAAARAQRIVDLVRAPDRRAFQALQDAACDGVPGRLEFECVTLGGRLAQMETHAAPLRDAAGAVVNALHVTRDVSERRAAEERLRDSERFSRLLLEASPDCIKVLDLEGRVEHVNGPGLELLEAHSLAALVGTRWLAIWAGDVTVAAEAALASALQGRSSRFQGAAPTLRGTPKHWDITVSPVRDDAGAIVRLLAVSRDVSESKHAGDRLRESEARFRRLSEGAPLGMFLNDADGRTVYANARAAAIVGCDMEDLLGDGWKSKVHPEDSARMARARREFRDAESERGTFDYRVQRSDGAVRTVVVHVLRLHAPDGVTDGFVGMVEDTTERHMLEQQLRQAQKMEAVGQLAGGVAHDFNNLLTIIGGHLDFARDDLASLVPPAHTVHEDLAEIARATERARALVRQLLTFSRKQVVLQQAVDLNAVVRGAEQLLHRVLGDEIVLGTQLAAELLVVRADAVQLEQVLVNLALNARDAMLTPGHGRTGRGGTLTIDTGLMTLGPDTRTVWSGLAPGSYVRLSVTDTGHGIDDATRARLFEPFFTTKPVGAGTGLGLATVYGIVAQSGGAIRVESAPGEGARFEIALPRLARAVAAPVPHPGTMRARGRGTVLVVEDEPAVRVTTRRLLERNGYTVLEARHGADALARLARAARADRGGRHRPADAGDGRPRADRAAARGAGGAAGRVRVGRQRRRGGQRHGLARALPREAVHRRRAALRARGGVGRPGLSARRARVRRAARAPRARAAPRCRPRRRAARPRGRRRRSGSRRTPHPPPAAASRRPRSGRGAARSAPARACARR